MSEKVTFQELIDSISGETDRSKQFTHDFLKGLVTVIHDGLEKDRNVNIAGLGKFDLRKVDEREGYNPQTGEPMTIPAHNKVVFKPYKPLRERVNAPYADREPRLIGDREEDTTKQQPDFIPSAPPTRIASGSGDDSGGGGEGGPDAPSPDPSLRNDPAEEAGSSVVEYAPGMGKNQSSQSAPEQEVNHPEKEKFKEWRASEDGPDDRFGFRKSRRHERSDANWMLITAAAIVMLLIVAASYLWIYNGAGGVAGSQQTGQVTEVQDPSRPETAAGGTGEDTPTGTGTAALNEITGDNETVTRRVESGQTLWSMARQEYDDPYLWPWIYGTNHSDIEDPDVIRAGASLAVPLPEGPQRSLSLSDSLQVAMGYVESYQWYRSQNSEEAKYYLYAATRYHGEVLEHTDIEIDQEDLAFATRPR